MEGRIFTDTTDFTKIDYHDFIRLGDNRLYQIIGNAKELRFGIEDPKFWVKRAIDLQTQERKIIKLVYHETFETTLGGIKIHCFRDPNKEARILELVEGHPSFMQGFSQTDSAGNSIRVLDIVHGHDFFVHIESLALSHEEYFQRCLPEILEKLVKAFEAIHFLHQNGFRHGDIRNDHLFLESDGEQYVWIDFDYDFRAYENPFALDLYGMGNILLYAIGMGFHLYYAIVHYPQYERLKGVITADDFSLLDPSRFLNLRKLYPYIPKLLNDILMHFSGGAGIYYESAYELIEDLKRCLYTFF